MAKTGKIDQDVPVDPTTPKRKVKGKVGRPKAIPDSKMVTDKEAFLEYVSAIAKGKFIARMTPQAGKIREKALSLLGAHHGITEKASQVQVNTAVGTQQDDRVTFEYPSNGRELGRLPEPEPQPVIAQVIDIQSKVVDAP